MKTYDWTKFPKTDLYQQIISEWKMLLDDPKQKEGAYQSFLQKHPAIFLTFIESYVVISKLKLGSDYETDFVVVKEGYSDGTIYELIEIESPHTKLFIQNGKPSDKLSSALQQIRDWKRWMIENRNQFKKILPTINTKIINSSRLKYKIVIGRRTDDEREISKRRQISEETGVEIISFDRLTEMAEARIGFLNEAAIYSAQMNDVAYEKKNSLANPFYKCINDSTWRDICYRGQVHFHSLYLDTILKAREYNEYFDRFKLLPGALDKSS